LNLVAIRLDRLQAAEDGLDLAYGTSPERIFGTLAVTVLIFLLVRRTTFGLGPFLAPLALLRLGFTVTPLVLVVSLGATLGLAPSLGVFANRLFGLAYSMFFFLIFGTSAFVTVILFASGTLRNTLVVLDVWKVGGTDTLVTIVSLTFDGTLGLLFDTFIVLDQRVLRRTNTLVSVKGLAFDHACFALVVFNQGLLFRTYALVSVVRLSLDVTFRLGLALVVLKDRLLWRTDALMPVEDLVLSRTCLALVVFDPRFVIRAFTFVAVEFLVLDGTLGDRLALIMLDPRFVRGAFTFVAVELLILDRTFGVRFAFVVLDPRFVRGALAFVTIVFLIFNGALGFGVALVVFDQWLIVGALAFVAVEFLTFDRAFDRIALAPLVLLVANVTLAVLPIRLGMLGASRLRGRDVTFSTLDVTTFGTTNTIHVRGTPRTTLVIAPPLFFGTLVRLFTTTVTIRSERTIPFLVITCRPTSGGVLGDTVA